MTNFYCLEPGDILKRSKAPGVIHVGVYLGNDKVLHNAPATGECVCSVEEFSNGEKLNIEKPPYYLRLTILNNAALLLQSPSDYNLLINNCEHTVSKVVTGVARSEQLAAWGFGLLILSGAFLLLKSGK